MGGIEIKRYKKIMKQKHEKIKGIKIEFKAASVNHRQSGNEDNVHRPSSVTICPDFLHLCSLPSYLPFFLAISLPPVLLSLPLSPSLSLSLPLSLTFSLFFLSLSLSFYIYLSLFQYLSSSLFSFGLIQLLLSSQPTVFHLTYVAFYTSLSGH